MQDDYRTPDERSEDWEGRFQPMYVVRDELQQVAPAPQSAAEPAPVQQPQPMYRPQPRMNRRRRILRWVLLFPFVACMACSFVYVIIPPPPTDILVLGVDARPGEGYVTRTDSIMLLGVQPRRMRVSLLSIPRDLFINVPGYGSQRINTVNVLGELEREGYGPELLSAGIENSFGIQPDKYARLNFDAFVQLVDAVGGVTINVPKDIVDYRYPTRNNGTQVVRFETGRQRMDGETALIYARTRHADDDYGRAERQQQVITALMRKLANPLNWGTAITVISLNVDTNMNPLEMALYAPPMLVSGATGTIDRLVIDRDYILPGGGGAVPNYEKLAPWLEPRFD
ncbi:MAG: LCP family protein [Chloroflexota bacterium]